MLSSANTVFSGFRYKKGCDLLMPANLNVKRIIDIYVDWFFSSLDVIKIASCDHSA